MIDRFALDLDAQADDPADALADLLTRAAGGARGRLVGIGLRAAIAGT